MSFTPWFYLNVDEAEQFFSLHVELFTLFWGWKCCRGCWFCSTLLCTCVCVCVSCRSCASVVHLMGTVPAVRTACCVWGISGRSAATAWVSVRRLLNWTGAQFTLVFFFWSLETLLGLSEGVRLLPNVHLVQKTQICHNQLALTLKFLYKCYFLGDHQCKYECQLHRRDLFCKMSQTEPGCSAK